MNTHAEYRRHQHQPDTTRQTPEGEVLSHLATHRDPSLVASDHAALVEMTTATGRRIAWIRPSEAHTLAAPLIGRGIDLHAELVRRARRSPAQAARVVRRLLPTPRLPHATTTTTWEGPSL